MKKMTLTLVATIISVSAFAGGGSVGSDGEPVVKLNISSTVCSLPAIAGQESLKVITTVPSNSGCKFTVANQGDLSVSTVSDVFEGRNLIFILDKSKNKIVSEVNSDNNSINGYSTSEEKIEKFLDNATHNSNLVLCVSLKNEIAEFSLLKCSDKKTKLVKYFWSMSNYQTSNGTIGGLITYEQFRDLKRPSLDQYKEVNCLENEEFYHKMSQEQRNLIDFEKKQISDAASASRHSYGGQCG